MQIAYSIVRPSEVRATMRLVDFAHWAGTPNALRRWETVELLASKSCVFSWTKKTNGGAAG